MLSNLPNEILLSIAEYNDNHVDSLNLARCCRRFYHLLQREIYTSIDLRFLCPWALSRLTHSLLEHPEFARQVHDLSVGVKEGYCPKPHRNNILHDPKTLDPALENLTHSPSDLAQWSQCLQQASLDPWIALLLPHLPNLRTLNLMFDYPATYTNRILESAVRSQKPFSADVPSFPHLSEVRSTWYDAENGLQSSRLLPFFAFPSMRKFSADMLVEDHIAGATPELLRLPPFSGITDIDLTSASSCQGMKYLVRACQGLKSFRYVHANASVARTDFDPARFYRSLEPQRESLERLEVRYDDQAGYRTSGSEREDEYFGPLRGFTALKEVSLRAANLLDWEKIEAETQDDGDGATTGMLTDTMPSSLRTLSIDQVDLCDMRSLMTQVEGLVRCAKTRFPTLGNIELQGDLHEKVDDEGLRLKDDVVDMTASLRGLCAGAGIGCRMWNRGMDRSYCVA